MDLRQLFTSHSWWGKLIGAFFGFLVAGPTGALFGLIIGNFFDRGLTLHFSQPFWHYHNEKNPEVREMFLNALFATLGHLAKANGQVSAQDIEYANAIIGQMKLNHTQKKRAQEFFVQGKSAQFNLDLKLHQLYKTIYNKPFLIRLFVDTHYQFIKQGNISEKQVTILNTVLSHLQLAPLYQHHQFARDFPWYGTRQQSGAQQQDYQSYHRYQQHQQHHQNYQQQPPPNYRSGAEDPYTILKIQPNATKAEVKQAYRRQISHYHPDKLIAKGASANIIKSATEKTQQIRKAYEKICLMQGW